MKLVATNGMCVIEWMNDREMFSIFCSFLPKYHVFFQVHVSFHVQVSRFWNVVLTSLNHAISSVSVFDIFNWPSSLCHDPPSNQIKSTLNGIITWSPTSRYRNPTCATIHLSCHHHLLISVLFSHCHPLLCTIFCTSYQCHLFFVTSSHCHHASLCLRFLYAEIILAVEPVMSSHHHRRQLSLPPQSIPYHHRHPLLSSPLHLQFVIANICECIGTSPQL